jgi:hypothetical protein
MPSWKDLANDADNVSTDDEHNLNTGGQRLDAEEDRHRQGDCRAPVRNQSWSEADLTTALAGADPAASRRGSRRLLLDPASAGRVRGHRDRRVREQRRASPGGGAVQNDLTNDIKAAVTRPVSPTSARRPSWTPS